MKKISLLIFVLIIVFSVIVLLVGKGEKPAPIYYNPYSMYAVAPKTMVDTNGFLMDIDFYLKIIDETHSNPYHLVSKDVILEKTRKLKIEIKNLKKKQIPAGDCYFFLQRMSAFLKDEHTTVWLNNNFKNWLEDLKFQFPFKTIIRQNKIYLSGDIGNYGIPEFAELISINDHPAGKLLETGMRLINQTLPHYREYMANKSFKMWLEKYLKISPPWTIKYKYMGIENSILVKPNSKKNNTEKVRKNKLYSESVLDDNGKKTPILVLPQFWYSDKKKYEKFVDDFFEKNKNKKQIVLDLRENAGGHGQFVYYLLDHLIDKPYLIHTRFDFKISEIFANYARQNSLYNKYWNRKIPRLLWWFPFYKFDRELYYWWDRVSRGEIGEYVNEHNKCRTPDLEIKKFNGKVYLLISNYTNSAAVVFAAIFKYYNIGTIIGRETGGRIGFTSDPIVLQMPESKLSVCVPTAILTLPGDDPNRGVLPDIPVELSINELKNGKNIDRYLKKLKEILRKKSY